MITIKKYEIEKIKSFTLDLPKRAKILTVQVEQNDRLAMWALVNTEAETEPRTFVIYETGLKIDLEITPFLNYIGTVQIQLRSLYVLHLFEVMDLSRTLAKSMNLI